MKRSSNGYPARRKAFPVSDQVCKAIEAIRGSKGAFLSISHDKYSTVIGYRTSAGEVKEETVSTGP